MKKIFGVRFDFFLVVGLFLFFSTLYSLLSVVRHNHFQSQGNDFAIYDQALWLYSRFEKPYSTITYKLDLADRFRPIMLPVSVLYWFTSNERVLLIFQAIVLSAAVFPVWLLAKSKLPWFLALTISFLYLDFVGIQSTAAYDFHEMAILPLFLGWLFYFLDRRKWLSYFIVLFLCLWVREHVGFLLATLSAFIIFACRNVRVAVATFVISLFWSVLAIALVMPKLGQNYYAGFVEGKDSLGQAFLTYLKNPFFALESFFTPFDKIKTLFWSFFSFGLVPLVYIWILIPVFWQFASRFLDLQHPVRWTLYFHYSAELAVLMAVVTIYGVGIILKKGKASQSLVVLLAFFLIAAHLVTNAIVDAPLKNLLKKAFWQEEPWMDDTRLILSKVPEGASVQTQNNLLPHLAHRKEIYILPIIKDAQYIVFDLHPGQDNWNFYVDNLEVATEQFKTLIAEKKYKIIISAGDSYLLLKT